MNHTSKALLGCALLAPLAANAQTFTYSGTVQTYTVTQSGTYDIDVFGAAGGSANSGSGTSAGGFGAEVNGDVYLAAGTQLEIVAGGEGGLGVTYQTTSTSSTTYYAGGGGGGSFVYISENGNNNPLIIAGGGGGAGYGETGKNASLTTAGTNGGGTVPGAGIGGTSGAGGTGGSYAGTTYGDDGGGGGAWGGNGTAGALKSSGGGGSGAFTFTGGTGGSTCVGFNDYSCVGTSTGGFGGGGGGGYNGGGGGGGYSGGGGGSGKSGGTVFGGGGGTYVDPSVTLNYAVADDNTGNGYVTLTDLTPVPLPASIWLMLGGLGAFGFVARTRRAA